jgi:hypothetical protein
MTTASSIITDAYREGNLIPMGIPPTFNQQNEALNRLNNIILSTVGYEAGDGIDDLNIGGPYDQSSLVSVFIPDNARLILNLTSSQTFKLDPEPFEGQRLSLVDVGGNLSSFNVILDGNGRKIEGASSVTLTTDNDTRQWMYRADIGSWVKISTIAYDDDMPFPAEFDDYFITTLALRLSPRYGLTLAGETISAMKRARSLLRGRYHAWREVASDLDTRGFATDNGASTNLNSSEFNTGRPYPWR